MLIWYDSHLWLSPNIMFWLATSILRLAVLWTLMLNALCPPLFNPFQLNTFTTPAFFFQYLLQHQKCIINFSVFYFWILHPVVCITRIVGTGTVFPTILKFLSAPNPYSLTGLHTFHKNILFRLFNLTVGNTHIAVFPRAPMRAPTLLELTPGSTHQPDNRQLELVTRLDQSRISNFPCSVLPDSFVFSAVIGTAV
jgi:hypothetical protein